MHPGFSFEVDSGRNLVRFVLTGLFMPKDVSAFLEARREAHAQLTCAPGQHVTLTDLRAVGPTLVLRQLTRALDGRDDHNTRCFADIGVAEAWLLEG
jgi:hypothetical protein